MNKLRLWLLALCLAPSLAWAQVPFQFPAPTAPNAIPFTPSTSGTTAAMSAFIPAVSGKWGYLCGFIITSTGTTSSTGVAVTITGTVSPQFFEYNFVSSGQGLLGVAYPGCLTSSAENTPIIINLPAGGVGTTAAIAAWGFAN